MVVKFITFQNVLSKLQIHSYCISCVTPTASFELPALLMFYRDSECKVTVLVHPSRRSMIKSHLTHFLFPLGGWQYIYVLLKFNMTMSSPCTKEFFLTNLSRPTVEMRYFPAFFWWQNELMLIREKYLSWGDQEIMINL